jgi:hypothetical protein
MNPYV